MKHSKIDGYLGKPLIPNRVLLIGEGKIPHKELDRISDKQMIIFLREPDPGKWPSEMDFLIKYLTDKEKNRVKISQVLSKHENFIKNSVYIWIAKVCKDLANEGLLVSNQKENVLEFAKLHIMKLIGKSLEENEIK